jgi:ribosomal protein S27AE
MTTDTNKLSATPEAGASGEDSVSHSSESSRSRASPANSVVELRLRCVRCGFDQFKLTAHRLTESAAGDIRTECARCGAIEQPGYIPDIDPPQLQPSRDIGVECHGVEAVVGRERP